MPPYVFYNVVDTLYAEGIREFGLHYMGESTLNPHFSHYVKYIKLRYPDTFIFLDTNGLTNKFNFNQSLKYIDSLKLSINWWDKKSFVKNTGLPESQYNWSVFQGRHKMINDFIYYKKTNSMQHLEISVSSIWYNDPEQDAHIEQHIKPYVDNFMYVNMQNQGDKNQTIVQSEDLIRIDKVPCYALWNIAHINVDGYLCVCRWDSRSEWTKIGNILDTKFNALWNSKKMQVLREKHIKESNRNLGVDSCLPEKCKICCQCK